jgi:O-antigen/teichoic acid export membrane protein
MASNAPVRIVSLSAEVAWVLIGQALAVLGSLVGVSLVSGLLGPAGYGELALAMTAATLVQQVVVSPLAGACQRYFSLARELGELPAWFRAIGGLASSAALLVSGAACVAAVAAYLFGLVFWLPLLGAALVFAILSGASAILESIQTAARHRRWVAWHQATASWLRFGAASAFILVLGNASTIGMLGYCAAGLVVLVSQGMLLPRTWGAGPSSGKPMQSDVALWSRRMYGYAWPLACWGVVMWAQLASDRWALQALASTSDVGRYAVLYQLGCYPIMLLLQSSQQLLSPIFFAWAGDGADINQNRRVTRATNWLVAGCLALTALATALASGFHGPLFRAVAASEFHEVSWLLPWMVLAGGLLATGQLASFPVMSGVGTRPLLPAKLATGALGIGVSFCGAYLAGLEGVVMGRLLIAAVHGAWMVAIWRCLHSRAPVVSADSNLGLGGQADRR